jgi:hypothetical protein
MAREQKVWSPSCTVNVVVMKASLVCSGGGSLERHECITLDDTYVWLRGHPYCKRLIARRIYHTVEHGCT